MLDEAGFNSAAQWYVDGFGKRGGIKVRLDLATKRERLPIETALFRVLQESLTNVHRHSGALEVSIRFQYQPVLARVKEKIDASRMAESTREQDVIGQRTTNWKCYRNPTW